MCLTVWKDIHETGGLSLSPLILSMTDVETLVLKTHSANHQSVCVVSSVREHPACSKTKKCENSAEMDKYWDK